MLMMEKKKRKQVEDEAGVVVEAEAADKKKKKKMKKKKMQTEQPTNFSQLDETNALTAGELGRPKAKKPRDAPIEHSLQEGCRKRKNQKKQEGFDGVAGRKSAWSDDKKDMLFNFHMQAELSAGPQSDVPAICHRKDSKTGMVFVEDAEAGHGRFLQDEHDVRDADEDRQTEHKKKKKRRRKDDAEHNLIHIGQPDLNGNVQGKKVDHHTPSVGQQCSKPTQLANPNCMDAPWSDVCQLGVSSRPTYSMAVAGSIVDNAQSLDLATMLAGQIARAATIFRLDEIVVFDDYDGRQPYMSEEVGGLFMVRILKYLEVPQYLRKALIPKHQSLSSVGKLPPLDASHHLRKHEWRPFREGVVVDRECSSVAGSYVDVGLDKEVLVGQSIKPGQRVTVAMGKSKADGNVLQVVDREAAQQAGFYWGYQVRYANCLSAVFDGCPFEGKYDFCIGTSEHGDKVRPMDLVIPKCKHVLVAFGGLSGLEESLELDTKLKNCLPKTVFNLYLNTCPSQGSRTIRTEEAILISLQFLQGAVQEALGTL